MTATVDRPEAQKAAAAVHDLVDATSAEKRAMSVDHRLVMSEVQLLLAEKRTSFALLRTGVTVMVLPLSVASVLVATSALWSIWDVWWIVVPLAVIAGALLALGGYLIVRAFQHFAHTDRVLSGLRASDTLLEDLLIEHGRADRVLKPWRWRRERTAR
jgi:uncharacterized membrane protein YidH (DUF202 family)